MISFTLGWKRNRLFLYSASREIVSINASIKEAAFGRLHKRGAAFGRPPFVDSFIEASMETISLLAE